MMYLFTTQDYQILVCIRRYPSRIDFLGATGIGSNFRTPFAVGVVIGVNSGLQTQGPSTSFPVLCHPCDGL